MTGVVVKNASKNTYDRERARVKFLSNNTDDQEGEIFHKTFDLIINW